MGELTTALEFFDYATGCVSPPAVFAETVVLATSRDLGWDGVAAEYGRSRSFAPDDLAMSGHYVAINLARAPLVVEAKCGNRFQPKTVTPGSFWIMPADMPFTQRNRGAAHWGGIEISRARTRRTLGHDLDLALGYGVLDEPLAAALHALLHEVSIGGTSGPLYLDGIVTAIIARLASCHVARPVRFPYGALGMERLRAVNECIEDTLCQQVSVGDLAASVGLSQAHFAREFKRATGRSPHAFIVERRLERAWRLLTTGKNVAEAAADAGFSDQAHLSRLFKHRFGMTPGAFRRRRRK